jgi:purine-binding chemotaxis protein CheW
MSTKEALKTSAISQQLVVFSLGEEEYALPITHVQEIIRYAAPRAVASEVPWIRGVISLRGKIVPVCDLAARLDLPTTTADDKRGNIVIVETSNGTAGVIVDDVEEVLTVDETQLDSVPGTGSELSEAIAKVDDRLVILLNPDGVFEGVEFSA